MRTFVYTDADTGESIEYQAADGLSEEELRNLGGEALLAKGEGAAVEREYERVKNNIPTTKPREFSSSLGDVAIGVGKAGLGALSWALDKSDQYFQAPTKSGLSSAIKNIQEGDYGDVLPEAVGAWKNQMGKPTVEAPTGESIAKQLNLSDSKPSDAFPGAYSDTGDEWLKMKRGGFLDPTSAEAMGFVIDYGSDLTNYSPKGLVKGGFGLAKKGLSSVGSFSSGMPKKDIYTYLTRNKEVRDRINKFGVDTRSHSDDVTQGFLDKIAKKKKALGDNIEAAVTANKGVTGSVNPVLDSLQKELDKLHPILQAGERNQLSGLISIIRTTAEQSSHYKPLINPSGLVGLGELNTLKRKLQKIAKPAYYSLGAIKPSEAATPLAFQAKKAATVALLEMSRIIELEAKRLKGLAKNAPDIASKLKFRKDRKVLLGLEAANVQLNALHGLKGRYSPSLLNPATNSNKLLMAGSGKSPVAEKALKDLGEFADDDFLQQAQDFSAATAMKNAPLMPTDSMGRAGLKGLVGTAGLSAILSPLGPVAVPIAAGVVAAASSPKMTRAASNALLATEKYGRAAKDVTRAYKSSQADGDQIEIGYRQPNPEDVIALLNRDSSTAADAEKIRLAAENGQQSYAAELYRVWTSNPKARQALENANK